VSLAAFSFYFFVRYGYNLLILLTLLSVFLSSLFLASIKTAPKQKEIQKRKDI